MNLNTEYGFLTFTVFVKAFIIIFAMPVHNIVQAYTAKSLGDNTAIIKGFDSLNPLVHVDFRGIFAFLIFDLSWTRPVPKSFTKDNSKHPKLFSIITTLSGPLTYLVLSMFFIVAVHIVFPNTLTPGRNQINLVNEPVYSFLYTVALTLLRLFFVQFIPFYPFDGGELVGIISPGKVYYKLVTFINKYEGVFIILLILVIGPLLFTITNILSYSLYAFLDSVILNIFNLF